MRVWRPHLLLPLLCVNLLLAAVHAQQGATCSELTPCLEGCCSQYGSCGFGDEFCGAGCLNNCNAKAQCGKYGNFTACPLGVCCSQYGFCGTTSDFCDSGCQNGCEPVVSPSCASTTDTSSLERVVAYYELFQFSRPCDTLQPETIPAGALTHINLAFIEFGSDWKLIDQYGDIVARVSRLKATYAGLRVNVAIGGWNFNDPPTASYFSTMAASYDSRQTFIQSVISYLQKYGLDGIDIDWEYPTASDRGGIAADTDNFVVLLAEMRQAFDAINPGWDITCTLPSSYWYLQNFDLQDMQRYVSWFNFMSYDLHGMWDQLNQYTGAYLRGHTNLTEIDQGFDLLWRNNIDPKNVVMGMGFYGRSFTMTDATCWTADCTFSTAGYAGDCSQTAGILYYSEIAATNSSFDVQTYYDPVSTVKYNVYNGNQWVSYDDAQSWADKMAYLTSKCLSGVMIWALDQDDAMHNALTGLLGEDAMAGSLMEGGALSAAQKEALASQFAAYTGQDCYVTDLCSDGSSAQQNHWDYVCAPGYSSIATAHAPLQSAGLYITDSCPVGEYQHICCPTNALPKHCQWNGAPIRSEIGCSGVCGSDQFQLNIDTYVDADGTSPCYQGHRSLCCDNTEVLNQCFWTGCQGPYPDRSAPTCPTNTTYMTQRYDNGQGQTCASLNGGGSMLYWSQAYCCPNADVPQNCSWPFESRPNTPNNYCYPSSCDSTQVQYTTALDPPNPYIGNGPYQDDGCEAYTPPARENPNWPYCCNPPEAYNEKWPVDPSYLWANPYEATGDDVEWAYVDNYGNNNDQSSPGNSDGQDPYGFVMLDGPPGSIDSSFASTYEVVRRSEEVPMVKRSLVTSNRTRIDTNFDHVEEIHYIFCKYPTGSARCDKLFYDGAEDTIIHLPDHIGEGPFARLVSIQPVDGFFDLPYHHRVKRDAQGNENPVYRIKIDYNFQAIKRDSGPINMRVDYTNLLDYWQDVTDTPATRRKKRSTSSVKDDHLSYRDWRTKVRSAKTSHEQLRKRQADILTSRTSFRESSAVEDGAGSGVQKRWFGAFLNWLKKLNTVESSNVGYLQQYWKQSLLLYRGMMGCSKSNAKLSIYLDSEIAMDSTYAYYLSGTLVPPSLDGTYAYFGVQPSVYMGVTVQGDARMQYTSERKPLISTISYPGLAIKGIAAVGPTLDIYGQIMGVVQISGTMSVGAKYTFEKTEVYWPQDTDGNDYSKINDLVGPPAPAAAGLEPQFQASVQAIADLDILVTPEANIGITVGGSSLLGGVTLVDAQLVGFVNTTLRFHADASAVAAGDSSGAVASYMYNYGVYLLYNLGFGGHATIPLYNWYMAARTLFPTPNVITLYSNSDVASTTTASTGTKRSIPLDSEPLFGGDGDGNLTEPRSTLGVARVIEFASDHGALWGSAAAAFNISDAKALRKRDDSSDVEMTGAEPQLSLAQALTCPPQNCAGPGSSNPNNLPACRWILPDLRYNCKVFADRQAVGPNGQSEIVFGICTNVQKFFTRRNIPPSEGLVLTWDSDSKRQNARRRQSCPQLPASQAGTPNSGYCSVDNDELTLALGLPSTTGAVSCDEFPFASSEEGGNFYPTLQPNPTAVGVTCAPVWQQTIQGQCNKLLSSIATNVNLADNPSATAGSPDALFVPWAAGQTDWVSTSALWQRLAAYLSIIPQAAGIDSTTYAGGHIGYYQKRNFTLSLANPSGPSDTSAWGQQSLASYSGTGGVTGTDATQVACAINIFDQTDRYQITGPNGICLTGAFSPNTVYGNIPLWVFCNVQFIGTATNTNSKRDGSDLPHDDEESIGEFSGWKIKKITIPKDAKVVMPAAGYVPEGDMLPFEYEG